jgi:heterodisulfide reductase subunit B
MKYSLFLGCTIPARARNYEMSARQVAEVLGVEFEELPGYTCCGFPIKGVDLDSFRLLAAWNLALAEEKGLPMVTLCSACTGVLTEVNHELKEHSEMRDRVNEALSRVDSGAHRIEKGVEVKHFARLLYEDIGLDAIREKVVRPLEGLKVAPHYGCHYLKPSEIYEGFDDPEDPKTLDELVSATGAESLNYEDRKWCCGGALLAVDPDISFAMANRKLDRIKAAGADAITLVCPFCSVMYDDNQKTIETKFEKTYGIPVLYYPQLLGLAFGLDPKALGLRMNRVKTKDLIARF